MVLSDTIKTERRNRKSILKSDYFLLDLLER
nr:MAG TPA: hypothetical protein [Caudoviricetes sp.]